MIRVRVESAVKIKDISRVRVESRWSSFESELSQLNTAWVKVESLIFLKSKRHDYAFICGVTGNMETMMDVSCDLSATNDLLVNTCH